MHASLQQAVIRMLAPLVRLLLRHGVSHADFTGWAKQVYVQEANRHFGINEKKTTVSRLAILTGINRKEVRRILDLPEDATSPVSKHNRAIRVVTGWIQDSEFCDADGKPLPLQYGDGESSFNRLVRLYGGDVPARALLDELRRVGCINETENTISLRSQQGYVPHESEEDLLDLFADSSRDLLNTLDHNLSNEGQNRLQLSVAYDNVSAADLYMFKKQCSEKALNLLRELDSDLAKLDRGGAVSNEPNDRFRTGLGLYFIEEAVAEKTQNEN